MNAHQASVLMALIDNDPERKANAARGAACKVGLIATDPNGEETRRLREELARLKVEENRRLDELEQTARTAV